MRTRLIVTAALGGLVAATPRVAAQQTVPQPSDPPIYACEIRDSELMRVTEVARLVEFRPRR